MSKNDFILEASPREDVGKGASRRLRRLDGAIPAIIYGADKEPSSITLQHKDILHAADNEAFFSHVITINMGKTAESVIIKDLQRHPSKPRILHADFLRVSADHAITVRVPLHFLNEEKCVGVKQNGGVLSRQMNELEISCLPKDLPEYIEIDVLALDVGDSLHISDLTLPAGVTSIDLSHGESGDHAVVAVTMVKEEVIEEEAPEAEVDEEAEADEDKDEADDEDKDD
ncbi:MAG: 50S ribosomal protein L25/general stress protein Ctc [Pseudohongiellaceae bacterium]